jgi:Rps23 Pro-64 3,4-dihydroxylase Tpa1-like proline 4-hydroxylase
LNDFPSQSSFDELNYNMDVSLLPPNVKMIILGHTAPSVREEVLKVRPESGIAPVSLFSQLRLSNASDDTLSDQKTLFAPSELQQLETRGFIIKDKFSSLDLDELHLEVQKMKQTGLLKSASMSNSTQEAWNDPKTRGDLHHWLNEDTEHLKIEYPVLRTLLQSMDALRLELNEKCDFKSERTQTQIACYPGEGARYVRHLDSTPKGPDRRLTCLFYLNKDWKTENGGSLRIFLPKTADTESLGKINDEEVEIDIEPLLNRLVIFQSRTVPHEVLPAHSDRMAITMWFY